jgi:hypothetical protein
MHGGVLDCSGRHLTGMAVADNGLNSVDASKPGQVPPIVGLVDRKIIVEGQEISRDGSGESERCIHDIGLFPSTTGNSTVCLQA